MLRHRLVLSALLIVSTLLPACQDVSSVFGLSVVPTPTPVPPPVEPVVRRFLQAWEEGDYAAMYELLAPSSQVATPEEEFVAAYTSAADTMTLSRVATSLRSVLQEEETAQADFSASFETLIAGSFEVANALSLRLDGERWGVLWSPACILPYLMEGNQLYLEPEVPLRGNIYDRSGRALAVNGMQAVVGVVPGDLQDAGRTLLTLSQILEEPIASLQEKYASTPMHWFVPLGVLSSDESTAHYDALAELPGVVLKEKPVRIYRDGELAAHVMGYVGSIHAEEMDYWRQKGYPPDALIGAAGLEAWGEEVLAGRRGGVLSIVSPGGNPVVTLSQQDSGRSQSVYTTLDRALQEQAVTLLESKRGAVVALDPHTGQVLALVSSPTFDANLFVPAISAADWERLMADPGRPMMNRATQGLYPPASTFKIVTMSAGLETGLFAPASTFTCEGVWKGLGANWSMLCWIYPRRHGTIDFVTGLVVSCDSVFYQVGYALYQHDVNALPTYARGFGLGKPTGLVGLPTSQDGTGYEQAGLVPDPAWKEETHGVAWTPGDSVNIAIGQGYLLTTPLQMAVLISAVGNGGTLYRPQLVERIGGTEEASERIFSPEVQGTLPVSAAHLAAVREGLRRVVSDEKGTGRYAFRDSPLSAAGKTGTGENPGGDPHAWFIGYAPADDPQIAIVALVEHGGEGSVAAAPIFRALAESFLGIEPEEPAEGASAGG